MDDDSWRFFLLFEKSGRTGECQYAVAGYLTVYQYYAYGREVNMKRPRISQMLVLPRYQRQGLGSQLLDTVYRWAGTAISCLNYQIFSAPFLWFLMAPHLHLPLTCTLQELQERPAGGGHHSGGPVRQLCPVERFCRHKELPRVAGFQ